MLESRLAYQLRCLQQEATNPELGSLDRLAVVWDGAKGIEEKREKLPAAERTSAENLLIIRRPALAAPNTHIAGEDLPRSTPLLASLYLPVCSP
jgi:hypothetical protein